MKFFEMLRFRRAQKRLLSALNRCTQDDLKRAAALCDWLRVYNVLPGDKITLTFDTAFGVAVDKYEGALTDTKETVETLKEFEK